MDYSYAYLVGNIVIAFPAWLILFFIRKDLRKEMLAMSIMGAFLGPISEIIYFNIVSFSGLFE